GTAFGDLTVKPVQLRFQSLASLPEVLLSRVSPGFHPLDTAALLRDFLRSCAHFEQMKPVLDLADLGPLLGQAAVKVGNFDRGNHHPRRGTVSFTRVKLLEEAGDRSTHFGPGLGANLERSTDPIFDLNQPRERSQARQNHAPKERPLTALANHV